MRKANWAVNMCYATLSCNIVLSFSETLGLAFGK